MLTRSARGIDKVEEEMKTTGKGAGRRKSGYFIWAHDARGNNKEERIEKEKEEENQDTKP